jgi:hypothetical protein
MNEAEEKRKHVKRHIELHSMLDELLANYITATENIPSRTSLLDLMTWSASQTDPARIDHSP